MCSMTCKQMPRNKHVMQAPAYCKYFNDTIMLLIASCLNVFQLSANETHVSHQ